MTSQILKISGNCRKIKLQKFQYFAILFIHLCYPRVCVVIKCSKLLFTQPLPIIFKSVLRLNFSSAKGSAKG